MPSPGAASSSPSRLELGLRPLAPVGYLAFGLIVLDQLLQVAGSVQGFGPSPSAWRFQFATSFAARVAPLIMVLLGVLGLATITANRRAARLAGFGLGLVAVMLAAGAVALWFDGAVVKRGVEADQLLAFTAQWLRGLVLSGVGFFLFGGMAIGVLKRV